MNDFILNPASITEDVRSLAVAALAATPADAKVVRGVLADALEETGEPTGPGTLTHCLRAGYSDRGTIYTLRRIAVGHDFAPAYARQQAEAAELAAKRAKTARDRVCLFAAGVTGCPYSLNDLAARITRTRPRGSGSRAALAARLAAAMNARAAGTWAAAKAGQRKPSPKAVSAALAEIAAKLDQVQDRARERLIDAADVVAAARQADETGTGHRDGGTISCGSYGYAWSTTTATATRLADGTVRVRVARSGTREIVLPARVWAALAAPVVA